MLDSFISVIFMHTFVSSVCSTRIQSVHFSCYELVRFLYFLVYFIGSSEIGNTKEIVRMPSGICLSLKQIQPTIVPWRFIHVRPGCSSGTSRYSRWCHQAVGMRIHWFCDPGIWVWEIKIEVCLLSTIRYVLLFRTIFFFSGVNKIWGDFQLAN